MKKMRKSKKQPRCPREARTDVQLDRLPDGGVLDFAAGWVMVEPGEVILANQRWGETRPTGEVRFRRHTFERIVDWYNGKLQKART
ncbi:MAG: hypothetical protein KatS3mg109_1319 [Pirellulaceae bacterium]|nr:MAG: hypothetical protein KatS3mg109_1319 [Pirellulaceae bacterium]